MAEQGVVSLRKLWMGGYRFDPYLSAIAQAHTAEAKDNTKLGMDTRSNAGGMPEIRTEMSGFWDSAADAALASSLNVADVPLSVGVLTGAEGEVATTHLALMGQYDVGAAVGDMLPFDVSAVGRGSPLVRGLIVHNALVSSSGDGTGYQYGQVSAGKSLYAALHVIVDNGTSLDVIIESDDNAGFTSATTRVTFAQATAIGGQWLSAAGPITDNYWRVSHTVVGTSFTYVVVLGIK